MTASTPCGVIACCENIMLGLAPVGYKISISLSVENIQSEESVYQLTLPEFFSYSRFEAKCDWLESMITEYLMVHFQGCVRIHRATMSLTPVTKKCLYCQQNVENLEAHVLMCKLDKCFKCLKPLNEGNHELCNVIHYKCEKCPKSFCTGFDKARHMKNCTGEYNEIESSIGGKLKIFRLTVLEDTADYEGVLRENKSRVEHCLSDYIANVYPAFHFSLYVRLTTSKYVHGDERQVFVSCGMQRVLANESIGDVVNVQIERTIEEVFRRSVLQSGWVVKSIDYIDIYISQYHRTAASSYIALPPGLRNKKSLVNPLNHDDDMCFLWAILMDIFRVEKNKGRISQYRAHVNKIDMAGVKFPVPINQISRIEQANDLIINVFKWDDKFGILPVRASERNGLDMREINLLLLEEGEKSHYVLISSKSGFFRDMGEGDSRHNYSYWCARCIRPFTHVCTYMHHLQDCKNFGEQKTKMPKHKYMQFKEWGNTVPAPVWVLCDFETIQMPESDGPLKSVQIQPISRCIPISFVYKVCSDYPQYDEPPVTVIAEQNCGAEFIKQMNDVLKRVSPLLNSNTPITPLTPEEERIHETSPNCHICKRPFLPGEGRKKDHDHYPMKPGVTSNYLGPAHNGCNLKRGKDGHLPILFHNFSGFDIHLFFKDLCNDAKNLDQVNVLRRSGENYTHVSTRKFRFVDSIKHLPGSLSGMAQNLESQKLINLKKFSDETYPGEPRKHEMLQRKLIFPYNYLTSVETLDHAIPPRHWFTDLEGEGISDREWDFLQEFLQEFGISTLRELLIIYNIVDTLLLADVWAEYRARCLEEFGLEPAKYQGCPALTFDASLKMTGEKLELLKNPDFYNLFERGIRGGTCFINTRQALANNPAVGFNPKMPTSHILMLDSNNLYGKGMMLPLPYSDFRDENPALFSVDRIKALNPDAERGYLFVVNLGISAHAHDELNDYPIAPSKLEINEEIISPYSKTLRELLDLPEKFSSVKLAPNLLDKERYITALPNLQFYISKGAIVTEVLRVVSFVQKAWMRPYIEKLTECRRSATTESEKYRYKISSNACFGKFIQNVRDYEETKIIRTPADHKLQACKPEFKGFTIFDENLASIHLREKVTILDRPVYAGWAILESSKLEMYKAWYEVIRVKWPSARLLFTDTDSFLMQVFTDTLVDDLRDISDHLDLSNIPPDHPLYSDVNKFVPGKFKSEVENNDIREFIGLRSKMYSMTIVGEKGEKKKNTAAGTKKAVAKKLQHEQYREVLENMTKMMSNQKHFRSKGHEMYLININKTSLSCYDDKRYLLQESHESYAYGHVQIEFNHAK